jgi:hypothetical protein
MEPTAFELAPLEASQSPSPHIQTAPLLAGGGGVLADPSSGCGGDDNYAGLACKQASLV